MKGFRRAIVGSTKKKYPSDPRALRSGVYGNDYKKSYGLTAHLFREEDIGIQDEGQTGILRDNEVYLEGDNFRVVGAEFEYGT